MPGLSAMAASVGERLKASGASLGVSESSCGGLISAALVAVPGASAYYLGGGVIYTAASRAGLLAITPQAMEGLRASTEAYALLNARTIRQTLGATWGLAETGASGPTGNRYGDDCRARLPRGRRPGDARHHAWRPARRTGKRTCGRLRRRPWICCWNALQRKAGRAKRQPGCSGLSRINFLVWM